MAKLYRKSQKHIILGRQISGFEMHKYGLPYRNAAGMFLPQDRDDVDLMLAAAERYPELHIVTWLDNGHVVNRYEETNASAYLLYPGNADPEIEFTEEFSDDDYEFVPHEIKKKFFDDFAKDPFGDPVVQMAVRWLLENNRKKI